MEGTSNNCTVHNVDGETDVFELYHRSDVRRGSTPTPVYAIFNKLSLFVSSSKLQLVSVPACFHGLQYPIQNFFIGKFSAFVKLMKETVTLCYKNICSESC